VIHPLGPKFTLRNNPGAPEQLVVKRGTDEIREHLKHLGPSNLASRPRQTRYQNVKIKAPGTSPTRSGMTDSESGTIRRPSEVASNGSGIGSKFLRSPSFQAKDGVLAVQQGYGTIDGALNSAASPLDGDQKRQINDVILESQYERDSATLTSTPQRTPKGSTPNSLHSVENRRINSFRSGPARSGSITEQVIDLNGVRKVILQTTSSSSSDEDLTSNDKTSPVSQRPSAQETAQIIYEQAIESEHDGGSASTSKKKRRRRKKKKHGDDPENAPLLPK
jgi:metal transporter CNNM